MSAATAIHSVAAPATASTRNAPFSTIENAMFARMLRVVARLRRKLDDPFDIKLLHTIRGVGFSLRDSAP